MCLKCGIGAEPSLNFQEPVSGRSLLANPARSFSTEAVGNDAVNHPSHYIQGKIEVIDFLEDQGFGYLAGQVIKYVARYRFKGRPKEDLEKAEFYLKRLIARDGADYGKN